MTITRETARTAALIYAFVVFGFSSLNVLGLLTHDPIPWRQVVGHTGISIVAPLLPLAALMLGLKFARTSSAQAVVNWSVVLATVLPLGMVAIVVMSAEPLAMLALLFVPPMQFVGLVLALLVAWMCNRDQRG